MGIKAFARDSKAAERRVPRQRKRVDYLQRLLFIGLKYVLHHQARARGQYLAGQPQPLHREADGLSGGRRNRRETRNCAHFSALLFFGSFCATWTCRANSSTAVRTCLIRQGLTPARTQTITSLAIACCHQAVGGETAGCAGFPSNTRAISDSVRPSD